jgi:hypothetical protein
MKSIRTFTRASALAILVGLATAASAHAAVVSVLPSPVPDKTVGDTFSVDIVISGLLEEVGGFSLFLDFDDTVIASTGYTLDPGAVMDPAIDQSVFTAGVSPLELYFFSDFGADLSGQGTGFTLATVDFSAIANGFSRIVIRELIVSDAEGVAEIDISRIVDSQVCVGGSCVVPEPATFTLFATGIATLLVRRRRRSQA